MCFLFYRDYSLSGAYRHLLVKPKDVNWSTYKYNNVAKSLALSDWDKMNGEPEPESIQGKSILFKGILNKPSLIAHSVALQT